MAEPKILYLDIENTPSLGYVWGMWDQNVIEMEQDWFMLSFAYSWNGGAPRVKALPDYKGYNKDKTNDKSLVLDLWRLLDSADVVIAHNADAFDIKKANARFLVHGLRPPTPYKTIDTLKIARRHFKFDSNRLDDLARQLGLGRKLATKGKNTWLGCMAGDEASWRLMKKYNKQDVKLGYDVYLALRPWATTHPNLSIFAGSDGVCPRCLAKKLQRRGTGHTLTTSYPRYQCTSCGGWSRGKGEQKVTIR